MPKSYHTPRGSVSERVYSLLKYGDVKKITNSLKIHQSTFYNKINGITQFTQNELIFFCEYFKVSADWLLLGKGDKNDSRRIY